METATLITSLITAIISLIAALVSLYNNDGGRNGSPFSINGNNNEVYQDNSCNTYNQTQITVEKRPVRYISVKGQTTNSEDDSVIFLVVILVLLFHLYKYRVVLLQVMWIPLILSPILSVLICLSIIKERTITIAHPNKIVKVVYLLAPFIVSILLMVQNIYISRGGQDVEFLQQLQIGITILCSYVGILFLIIAQLSTLIVHNIKYTKIKKALLNFARFWPFAIFLSIMPLIIEYIT